MNWLLIVVIALFGTNVYTSHKRGFIKTLFDTLTIVLAVLLTTVCAPFIASMISANEEIYGAIAHSVDMFVKDDESIDSDEEQNEYIDDMKLPSKIKVYLREHNTLEVYEERGLDSFTDYITDSLSMMVINVISYVAIFIIIRIGLIVITSLVDLISKMPAIQEFDGVGGILMGAVKGLIEIWILFLVITLVASTKIGASAMECISENFLLDMLYTNNALLQIIYSFI